VVIVLERDLRLASLRVEVEGHQSFRWKFFLIETSNPPKGIQQRLGQVSLRNVISEHLMPIALRYLQHKVDLDLALGQFSCNTSFRPQGCRRLLLIVSSWRAVAIPSTIIMPFPTSRGIMMLILAIAWSSLVIFWKRNGVRNEWMACLCRSDDGTDRHHHFYTKKYPLCVCISNQLLHYYPGAHQGSSGSGMRRPPRGCPSDATFYELSQSDPSREEEEAI
jgi:hypothetical protein